MVISLDVFDTAITRTVYKPTDAFDLLEEKLGRNFAKKRIHAENLAKKENNHGYGLEDIYKFLSEFDMITEINFDIDICYPIQPILGMYNKNPDNYIFISDMYLSSDVIIKILEKCGYKNPKVFVSCEYGCCKSTGELFRKVENIVGKIDKHYGDNYKADVLGAQKAGIEGCHVPYNMEQQKDIYQVQDSRLKKFILSNQFHTKDLITKVTRYFSPMVYAFTKWILDNRKEGQKIFFNARDGYLPYIIAKDILKEKDIYYSHISRKSILTAGFNCDEYIDAECNKIMFDRLMLMRADNIVELAKAYNYPNDDLIDNGNIRESAILNQHKLMSFFRKCKNNAVQYIKNIGLTENDMFVDIGYYGSLQLALNNLLGHDVKGYYLQHVPYLKADLERYSYFDKHIIYYKLLIEAIFSSSEDGVNGYNEEGEPLFYPDNKHKKEFSEKVTKEVLEVCKFLHKERIHPTKQDIESLARRFIYTPTLEESYFGDDEIFENGGLTNYESIVCYNRERIKAGEIQKCYDDSYWRPAFLTRLRADKELSYLEKFLDKRELE